MNILHEPSKIQLKERSATYGFHVYGLIVCILLFSANFSYSQERLLFSAPMANAFANETEGRLEGPAVDLIKLLFRDYDVEVKTVPLPWMRLLEYIKDGEIDAVAPIFYNAERARFISYSIPFGTHDTKVLVRRGHSFTFKKREDLIGFRGIAVRGRSEGEAFDRFSAEHLNLQKVNSLDQIIKMILKGRADYGIDKLYDIIAISNRLEVSDQIGILDMTVATNNNCIGFSKKSPFVRYIPQINKKILQLKKEGKIEEMVLTYVNSFKRD
jgi:polar amino acid transport system substrate-binding protein